LALGALAVDPLPSVTAPNWDGWLSRGLKDMFVGAVDGWPSEFTDMRVGTVDGDSGNRVEASHSGGIWPVTDGLLSPAWSRAFIV